MTGTSNVVCVAAVPLLSEIKASDATNQIVRPASLRNRRIGQLPAVAGAILSTSGNRVHPVSDKDAATAKRPVIASPLLAGKP